MTMIFACTLLCFTMLSAATPSEPGLALVQRSAASLGLQALPTGEAEPQLPKAPQALSAELGDQLSGLTSKDVADPGLLPQCDVDLPSASSSIPRYLAGEMYGNIAGSTKLISNLGSQGPDFDRPPMLKLANIGSVGSTSITVIIENLTAYAPADAAGAESNGKGGPYPFGFINLKCGTQTAFKFTFLDAATEEPVRIENIFLSFLDLDSGNRGEVREFMGVANEFSEKWVDASTELQEHNLDCNTTLWLSSTPGTGADNPSDPLDLTDQQQQRAVTLRFDNVSSIMPVLGLTTRHDGSCGPGRNLMFTFKSNLVPTPAPTLSPTPPPTPAFCPTCVLNKKAVATCCAAGGSWHKQCADLVSGNKPYTWDMGVDACLSTPAPTPVPTKAKAPTPSPTPNPTGGDASCGTCVIWGDPHIITFQAHRQRAAQHPSREEFFRTRGWKSDQLTVSDEGEHWLVTGERVQIQGLYKKNGSSNATSLASITLSGPFLQGQKLVIQPLSGKTMWQGKPILSSAPSIFVGELFNGTYRTGGKMVKDGSRGPAIDLQLPAGVSLTVNRWQDSLAAEITMCSDDGQQGQCGAFSKGLELPLQ